MQVERMQQIMKYAFLFLGYVVIFRHHKEFSEFISPSFVKQNFPLCTPRKHGGGGSEVQLHAF
jgi:hypothetical protein